MTFNDIMRIASATPDERDQCAWFLAMFRAKKIYEELRYGKENETDQAAIAPQNDGR